jgi:plastocyanin
MGKIIAGIVVLVIIIGGGYWFYTQSQNSTSMDMTASGTDVSGTNTDTSGTGTTGGATTGSTAPMSATVNYSGDAFSPSTVTIAQGGTVTFVSTASDMWVASNPHPVHTGYDGTSMQTHCAAGYAGAAPFDQCAVGSSFTFTFSKTGTWGYHNHMNPGLSGTVIVQ